MYNVERITDGRKEFLLLNIGSIEHASNVFTHLHYSPLYIFLCSVQEMAEVVGYFCFVF